MPAEAKKLLIDGLSCFKNPESGFVVLELHYSADPRKRAEAWKQREREGVQSVDWAREYELSWVTRIGKPVYLDLLARSMHVFGPTSQRGDVTLPEPDKAKMVVGYDLGPTASRMAASFNLVEQNGRRWTVDEVFVERGRVDEFLDSVEALLVTTWATWLPTALHVVDPTAIENISRIEEMACVDLMRLRGIYPIPGERSFVKRRKIVEDLLTKAPGGFPMLNVHERCVMHVEGFEGGYRYPEVSPGRGGGYGAIPVKNSYSDIHDAHQYANSRAMEVWQPMPLPGKRIAASYATKMYDDAGLRILANRLR